jgi:cytochrome c peroxidase
MMNSSYKLSRGCAVAVAGALSTFVPGVVVATPVDPAIMARFKQVRPGQHRPAAVENEALIEKGRRLFMTETFDGNGRTCATCHPPTNNFTIDPAFIARLPDSDPLFVAEFNPDLAELEDPELMRRFGLILENLDGFDKPGVFRGVPHTLGLRLTTTVDPAGDDNLTRADGSTVVQATGWSGDGAPGDGSLRSFAIGAIVQHFPKTMNRVPGEDFRLPTEGELDALETFQLSLGRQEEIDLASMDFADPNVQAGKDLFDGVGINRGCSFCHSNAGANDPDGFNRNFATNVANLTDTAARRFDPEMPGDGGFDSEPEYEVPGMAGSFHGNKSMNTASLIEAADTGPFFHNNSARTIEDAVHFYAKPTFSSDDPFQLRPAQVIRIAAFLRALNALENIRSSTAYSKQARNEAPMRARETVALIIPETKDAIKVLTRGPLSLYPEAVELLEEALDLERDARRTAEQRSRNPLLKQAEALKDEARTIILK